MNVLRAWNWRDSTGYCGSHDQRSYGTRQIKRNQEQFIIVILIVGDYCKLLKVVRVYMRQNPFLISPRTNSDQSAW